MVGISSLSKTCFNNWIGHFALVEETLRPFDPSFGNFESLLSPSNLFFFNPGSKLLFDSGADRFLKASINFTGGFTNKLGRLNPFFASGPLKYGGFTDSMFRSESTLRKRTMLIFSADSEPIALRFIIHESNG